MDLIDIQEKKGLARDMESLAVVNTDTKMFEAFKSKKEEVLRKRQEFNDLKNRVSNIEDTLKKILEIVSK